ncbi:hypothetical protein LBMAG20_11590 [Methylocystaceae bacterium]|nr:hypothetical protein LBMAG20_11590 [Methylocystaceae bacterium]
MAKNKIFQQMKHFIKAFNSLNVDSSSLSALEIGLLNSRRRYKYSFCLLRCRLSVNMSNICELDKIKIGIATVSE